LDYIIRGTNHVIWIVSTTVKEEVLEEGNNKLRREEVSAQADRTPKMYFFDDLVMGLADGNLTRGQALKVVGGAILGTALGFMGLGFFGADEAEARGRHPRHPRKRHRHRRRICPVDIKAGCGVTCVCPLGTSCNGAGICK
jgi:hypothetical protein